MNELTLILGGLGALVAVVILAKFGRAIVNTLAVAGLLGLVGLGALVYLRATGGPGQVVIRSAADGGPEEPEEALSALDALIDLA